jgi:uncharacterized membrane protein YcaP (DUF421 family)
MRWIDILFGHGIELNSLQMSCRALICFFSTLLFLRIAGVRTFGKKTAFDNVIIIMLGSVLSRAVVGASPFIPTTIACLVFVLIHWGLARLSYHFAFVGRFVKGERIVLYQNGKQNLANMRYANISKKDLLEGIRLQIHEDGFGHVKEIFIERNGEISVIRSEQETAA